MTGKALKPVRSRLSERLPEEAEEEDSAAAMVTEEENEDGGAYPGSPEPAPAQFSSLPPQAPGND